MAPSTPSDEALLERIGELRAAGLTPKQIARALRLRPAQVAPLVRVAAARAAEAAGEAVLVGCWVSPGWSGGLRVAGHSDWPDLSPDEQRAGGMATVVVARRHKPTRVSACGYLVDTHCLGVKNVLGPQVMGDGDLPGFLRMFFQPFAHLGPPLNAPLELARHLVYGAVDAARRLGFEPAEDFAAAATHLGAWDQASAITFGRDGVPCFVQGPYDDAAAVLRTLRRTVGDGNYHHYLISAGALATG
jgi:hypothetical protein